MILDVWKFNSKSTWLSSLRGHVSVCDDMMLLMFVLACIILLVCITVPHPIALVTSFHQLWQTVLSAVLFSHSPLILSSSRFLSFPRPLCLYDHSVALCCCQKQSAGGFGKKQAPAGSVTHRWREVVQTSCVCICGVDMNVCSGDDQRKRVGRPTVANTQKQSS